jgi:hypothetical protein
MAQGLVKGPMHRLHLIGERAQLGLAAREARRIEKSGVSLELRQAKRPARLVDDGLEQARTTPCACARLTRYSFMKRV